MKNFFGRKRLNPESKRYLLISFSFIGLLFFIILGQYLYGLGEVRGYKINSNFPQSNQTISYAKFFDAVKSNEASGTIYIVADKKVIFIGTIDHHPEKALIADYKKYYNENFAKMLKKHHITTKGNITIESEPYLAGFKKINYFNSLLRMVLGLNPLFMTVLFIVLIYYLVRSLNDVTANKFLTPQYPANENIIIGGIDYIKNEVNEIVDIIRYKDRFNRFNVKHPKGVILYGPPGNGKTLIAKYIAQQAGLPFLAVSGSQFVEKFVGTGASRVRRLFSEAKKLSEKHGGCIIFIDEIDSLGSRNVSVVIGHNEAGQTINEILVQLDGFNERYNIVVIGATNNLQALDPAIVRKGRFDRMIFVDYPKLKARADILRSYLREMKIASDVDIEILAKLSPGFSGADLANWVNEAAIEAIRSNHEFITLKDFDLARDRIIVGLTNNYVEMSEEEKRISAYHESGHALLRMKTSGEVQKVTIRPIGQALGVTYSIPPEINLYTRPMIENEIKVLLAGRCAEELFLATTTVGAADDLRKASELALRYVSAFGLSKEFGEYIPATDKGKYEAENEARNLLARLKQETMQILESSREEVEKLALYLIEYESIDYAALVALLTPAPDKESKSS